MAITLPRALVRRGLRKPHFLVVDYLKGRDGDRINAVLAAAGYNFSLLPCAGSGDFCAPSFRYSSRSFRQPKFPKRGAQPFFTADYLVLENRPK